MPAAAAAVVRSRSAVVRVWCTGEAVRPPPPGQVHTNYLRYASLYQPENVWVVRFINTLVCRAYCDRLVKLSDSLQARRVAQFLGCVFK